MSATSPASPDLREIAALTDQCVLCGLCLPACPTYMVSRSEAESPRGRISLVKALAEGTLGADPSTTLHLDQCLGCLACERVCPSNVDYARIIDAGRRRTAAAPDRLQRMLYGLAARPHWIRALARLAWTFRLRRRPDGRDRPQSPRRTGWRRALALLPDEPRLPPRQTAETPHTRGSIGLFAGCFASAFDRDTHASARTLLRALGYRVVEPRGQACCGALARHAGHQPQAEALAAPTRTAFLDSGVDTVLVSASGCFGTLADLTFAGTPLRVREIGEFLASDPAFAQLAFAPLPRRVALHLPCSLSNRVRAAQATRTLLQRIPELELVNLPDQPRCCGAGGSHMLRHPHIADTLRDERTTQIRALTPDLLVTSNIGCRLHLGAGLSAHGDALDIVHPITLLARHLKPSTAAPIPLA